jgi:hypothetical protein
MAPNPQAKSSTGPPGSERPQPLPVRLDNIPAELQARDAWVCWRYELRDGKWTKPPLIAGTDTHAKSTDSTTWRSFAVAQAAYEAGGYDGIGLVLSDDDEYTAIDLDHCIVDGELDAFATAIVRGFASYAERSPSGTGVRIIIKGVIPPHGRNKGMYNDHAVEVYEDARYVTLTGHLLGTPPDAIPNRQEKLEKWHTIVFGKPAPPRAKQANRPTIPIDLTDAALLSLACESPKNGAAVGQLYAGTWTDTYDSQSEADLALCNHLAFWFGRDAARMDTLFRQSGLYRDKWDARHYSDGRTYGQATIDTACAGTAETYTPKGTGSRWEMPDWPKHTVNAQGGNGNGNGHHASSPTDGDLAICPPLPPDVVALTARASDASPWLDAYIAHSRHWSPRAADGYHEAVGLWVLSTVAARRVYQHLGSRRYTSLYLLLAGRSSLFAKTTTTRIGLDVLAAADLDWLRCADTATPQKFIHDLTGTLPTVCTDLNGNIPDRIRNRLARPAQRGWYYEEFGQHLEAITRENGYMADFRGLLRSFDDHHDRYEAGTISRGDDVVEDPYLALLGTLTPADLKPLAKRGARMWVDGFWARFGFIVPDGPRKRERFPEGERGVPDHLRDPLQAWHARLGLPSITIHEETNSKADVTKRTVERGPWLPKPCQLGDGVYDAFYTYSDALLDAIETLNLDDLDSNYVRFAEKALRIAILLASLENDNRVELQHWARGQQIAERWRAGLHRLFAQVNEGELSPAALLEEQCLKAVEVLGKATARDVSRRIRGLSGAEAQAILESLVRIGDLDAERTSKTTRYSLPVEVAAHA